ncbi:alpha-crystallin domain-containing protein 22.3 isoform X4 [Manihot esculenta]|uniref:SHSP domain-containing protein n=1 Tax=Manihot esculenta TaxID=3983 RepID=A0A2C9VCM3_MANES|nr:alpha-crystallin domain-containing protein 22.3 isoform X4 [Manihot esculenta]OAY42255.1 hypothetical protein MANES_09G165200v8 [Manihot esculenta]
MLFHFSLTWMLNLEIHLRPFGMHGGNNEFQNSHSQQQPLVVQPLNSVPYIGSAAPVGDHDSFRTERSAQPVEKVGPSMVFLPSNTTKKEWDNIVLSAKTAVALTGSAAMGQVGPIVGLMDIGECDDAYLFRVSLPGVAKDEKEFSCDIEPDGTIIIKGVTTTGEKIVCKKSQIFRMQTQNLPPPGHFSITFQLPGPVDHRQFSCHFGNDGMLEGIVKKSIQ